LKHLNCFPFHRNRRKSRFFFVFSLRTMLCRVLVISSNVLLFSEIRCSNDSSKFDLRDHRSCSTIREITLIINSTLIILLLRPGLAIAHMQKYEHGTRSLTNHVILLFQCVAYEYPRLFVLFSMLNVPLLFHSVVRVMEFIFFNVSFSTSHHRYRSITHNSAFHFRSSAFPLRNLPFFETSHSLFLVHNLSRFLRDARSLFRYPSFYLMSLFKDRLCSMRFHSILDNCR